MLLRASGEMHGGRVDLMLIEGHASGDGGVVEGRRLLAFTDAVMRRDPQRTGRERAALRERISDAAFVDVCAVIGFFNLVDRVADASGIPLDEPLLIMSADVRRELDLARFASAANTPGLR